VLPAYHTPDADIYAIYPQRHQMSTRVRAFVEFIAESFGRSPETSAEKAK
jgi:DNA-binding transcriptional LysR family regulator